MNGETKEETKEVGFAIDKICETIRLGLDAPDGIVIWIVGRIENNGPGVPSQWHLQGTSFLEDEAIDMCRDENYWIGPLPVGFALPHRAIPWPGRYFPLKQSVDKSEEEKEN